MKAKSYAEAEALVKQNLGQMANDAEKAMEIRLSAAMKYPA